MSLQSILKNTLGLTDKESAVYLALLESGRSTVKPIADKAGVKRTSVYNFIDHLVELGVVNKSIIRGRKYFEAVEPENLLEIAKRRLTELEKSIPELSQKKKESEKKIRVRYFEGPNEIKNIMFEEPKCNKEALYLFPSRNVIEMIGGQDFMDKIDRQRIANGISIKAIRFKKREQLFPTSGHGKKYLRELRFAPSFFDSSISVAVYDTGKVAMISSKEEGFGVIIESQELCKLMSSFYDLLWKQCIPAKEGEG
ncbi:MAG: helix-turn-helix domain-containing protein [Bdellovibrionota bacterium]